MTIDGSERTNDVTAQLTDDQQHRGLINQSGCRNVSRCQRLSYSRLRLSGRSCSAYL